MPPEIQYQQSKSRTIFYSVGIIFLLLLAGLLYFYVLFEKENEILPIEETMNFQNQFNDSKNIALSKNNQDAAIDSLRETVQKADNKTDSAKAQIFLAGNLFERNTGSDRNEATAIYTSIALDENLEPFLRALAFNNIANVVNGDSVAFYKLYFPEKPFNTLLPETGSDNYRISKAYLEILKLSDSIYPTSYAKYAIAGNYYAPGLASIQNNERSERFDNLTTEEIAKIIQDYIAGGDALRDESLHVLHINLRKYLYRALGLNASGRVLGNIELETREEAFKMILLKGLEKSETDQVSEANLLRARLYYANFLFQNFGEERYENIRTILAPFAAATNPQSYVTQSIQDFYTTKVSSLQNNVIKEVSPKLYEISPEFRTFVDSIPAQ